MPKIEGIVTCNGQVVIIWQPHSFISDVTNKSSPLITSDVNNVSLAMHNAVLYETQTYYTIDAYTHDLGISSTQT